MQKKDLFGAGWKTWILPSIMLGLAPFVNPQGEFDPHLFGKLKWIAGGGAFSGEHPMAMIDWLDLLMHSAPTLILIFSFLRYQKLKKEGKA